MVGRLLALPIVAIIALVLSACSDGESPVPEESRDTTETAARDVDYVPENFAVGDEVYVRSLALEPAHDALWVGTSVGVMEIDLNTTDVRNTFTRDDPLANEYVFAIGIDSHGYKWFGTNAGGVSRYRDDEWKVFFPMHGLADYWVYAFAEQAEGPFWIGTWAGVNAVDLATLEFTTYLKELINEWVYGIAVDSNDRVWFGTEGGITMLDRGRWTHWTHADGLGAPNVAGLSPSTNTGLGTRRRDDLTVLSEGNESYNPNYVFSVHVDAADTVWAGTWGGGVARYDGTQWHNLTSRDGLAGNIVYSIARDAEGVFWFGTNKGLSRYDGKHWRTFDRSSGLLENHVYAIATQANGDVWVGTKRGVTRLRHNSK